MVHNQLVFFFLDQTNDGLGRRSCFFLIENIYIVCLFQKEKERRYNTLQRK